MNDKRDRQILLNSCRDRKVETMEQPVRINIDEVALDGALGLPERAKGVVIFAHGSRSSRLSPRNTSVARVLQQAGIGTFLFDLLTSEEDRLYERRFDIDLLARWWGPPAGWRHARN